MYCLKCYTPLPQLEPAIGFCTECGHPFDRDRPSTYLHRRFPSVGTIVWHLLLTTFLGVIVAMIVAVQQAAPFDGH